MGDNSATTAKPSEHQKKQKNHRWLSARWRDRCLAGFVWLAIIYLNSSLSARFPFPSFLQSLFEPEYRPYRVTVYLVLIAFVILWLRWRIFWFAVYLLLFPLVFPFLLIWFAATTVVRFTGWQVLILMAWSVVSATVRVIGPSGRAAAVALGMLPSCYLVILFTSNKYILFATLLVLFLASVRIVWGTFQWVLKPLNTLTWLIDKGLFYYNKSVEEQTFNFDPGSGAQSEKAKKAQESVENSKALPKAVTWVRKNLVTERSLLIMFLSVLLATLVLTTLNFGFLYYALQKSGPYYFSGTEVDVGISDFLYFSFMVMTTSDLSSLKPASSLTKFVTVAQLCCSFALLSFFVLVFSSIGRENLDNARSSLDILIQNQERKVIDWESRLKVAPLELPVDKKEIQ